MSDDTLADLLLQEQSTVKTMEGAVERRDQYAEKAALAGRTIEHCQRMLEDLGPRIAQARAVEESCLFEDEMAVKCQSAGTWLLTTVEEGLHTDSSRACDSHLADMVDMPGIRAWYLTRMEETRKAAPLIEVPQPVVTCHFADRFIDCQGPAVWILSRSHGGGMVHKATCSAHVVPMIEQSGYSAWNIERGEQ